MFTGKLNDTYVSLEFKRYIKGGNIAILAKEGFEVYDRLTVNPEIELRDGIAIHSDNEEYYHFLCSLDVIKPSILGIEPYKYGGLLEFYELTDKARKEVEGEIGWTTCRKSGM